MKFKELFKEALKTNIVKNVNVGVEINNFYNEFISIKDEKGQKKWEDKIKKWKTGTYKNKDLYTIYQELRDGLEKDSKFNQSNSNRKEFESAVKRSLNIK